MVSNPSLVVSGKPTGAYQLSLYKSRWSITIELNTLIHERRNNYVDRENQDRPKAV